MYGFRALDSHECFQCNCTHFRYTVDSIGTSSVVIYFLGGPSMIVPVVYAAVGGVCYWLQTPAFLQSEIVTDAKFVLFGE